MLHRKHKGKSNEAKRRSTSRHPLRAKKVKRVNREGEGIDEWEYKGREGNSWRQKKVKAKKANKKAVGVNSNETRKRM